MTTKDVLFSTVQKALTLCEPEDSIYSAVMVVVNNDDGAVQVYGLNIDELEVPVLLYKVAYPKAELSVPVLFVYPA